MAEGVSVGDGEGDVAEMTVVAASDNKVLAGDGSEAMTEGHTLSQAVPAEGHLFPATLEGSLQAACNPQVRDARLECTHLGSLACVPNVSKLRNQGVCYVIVYILREREYETGKKCVFTDR